MSGTLKVGVIKEPSSSTDNITLNADGSTDIDAGNIEFVGTGKRITGDFSNATVANRVMFQTSTTNGSTTLGLMPNGSGSLSNIELYPSSSLTNTPFAQIYQTASAMVVNSTITAGGSYTPMTFYTGGSERMRIATNGLATLQGTALGVDSANNGQLNLGGTAAYQGRISFDGQTGTTAMYIDSTYDNASAVMKFRMRTNGTSVTNLTLDGNGNVLHSNANGGLGYGTGAGGTVTQLTSKSTAVTLNKPTGQIVMNAASLAANTSVTFQFNNSLIASSDVVLVNAVNSMSLGSYMVCAEFVQSGSCYIHLRNVSAGALATAVVLNFAIIKGATS